MVDRSSIFAWDPSHANIVSFFSQILLTNGFRFSYHGRTAEDDPERV